MHRTLWLVIAVCFGPIAAQTASPRAAGCPRRRSPRSPAQSASSSSPSTACTDLLIRGDVPNIRGLLKAGSYTFWARTVAEAYTLPASTSMLTGVSPQKHGVTWNDHIEQAYPAVADDLRGGQAGGADDSGMASGKTKFVVFDKPGTLDWKYLPHDEPILDTFVARQAARMISPSTSPRCCSCTWPGWTRWDTCEAGARPNNWRGWARRTRRWGSSWPR